MTTRSTTSLLTLSDAAADLGVCYESIRRRVASGEIPSVRVGRAYRIHPATLESFRRSYAETSIGNTEVTVPPHARDAYAEYIARVVEAAPPLSADQVARLTTLLSSAAAPETASA